MESGITVIREQLAEWEAHLDNEFCCRQHFFEVWEYRNYDSIMEAVKVVRDLRRAIKFLDTENGVVVSDASHKHGDLPRVGERNVSGEADQSSMASEHGALDNRIDSEKVWCPCLAYPSNKHCYQYECVNNKQQNLKES